MDFIGCLLLAVSLSMDALGIGISYGVRKIRVPFFSRLIICVISIFITGAAVFLGGMILSLLNPGIAKFIGAGMLALLGCFIIFQAFVGEKTKRKKKCGTLKSIFIKPFGITIKIVRDPISCDFDKSNRIDVFEAVYLGVALSIDSFGVGISSAVSGLNSMIIPIAAGICQLCMLCIGGFLGARLEKLHWGNNRIWNIISGALLVIISVLRFFL